MNTQYDCILRNAHIIDPLNAVDGVYDIGVTNGKVSEIESHIHGTAIDEHDISGLIAVPGIVDLHVHVSSWLGGRLAAFMHRGLIMGAFRRMVGFFEKPAQRDPPRRFSAAEVL